jgi:hypothetical protein
LPLVLYRVFDLPEELRTRLRTKRAKAAATTAEVVQKATADSLPKLVATLRELGFRGDGKTRPARFAMTASSNRALKRASKRTGLPVRRLLLASIAIAWRATLLQLARQPALTPGPSPASGRGELLSAALTLATDHWPL